MYPSGVSTVAGRREETELRRGSGSCEVVGRDFGDGLEAVATGVGKATTGSTTLRRSARPPNTGWRTEEAGLGRARRTRVPGRDGGPPRVAGGGGIN